MRAPAMVLLALLMAAAAPCTDAGTEISLLHVARNPGSNSEVADKVAHFLKNGGRLGNSGGHGAHLQVQEQDDSEEGPSKATGGDEAAQKGGSDVANSAHGPALLSRFDFRDNVLKGEEGLIDHWVVEYCVHWWEPCQNIAYYFNKFSGELESEFNKDHAVTRRVRFARVNCATDKPLCNELGVTEYPQVKHYYRGEEVGSWNGVSVERDPKALQKFINTQLKKKKWGDEALLEAEREASDEPWLESSDPQEAVVALAITLASCWAFWGVARVSAPRGGGPAVAAAKGDMAAPQGPAAPRGVLIPESWADERQQILL